jgi:hypothetical protein
MTPLRLKIYNSQGENEIVFLLIGILFLLFEELFLSDQGFQGAYMA